MSNSGSHLPAKAGRMDTLLKVLDCLGKFLQIVRTGYSLFKHLA